MSIKPESPRLVLNMRLYKFGLPGNTAYVGRPSPFGNPFAIGRDGSRAEVIEKFKQWIEKQPELIDRAQRELRGKNLACWCAPLPCHADVLMQIANQGGTR